MDPSALEKVLVPGGHEDFIEYFLFLPVVKYSDAEETLFKLNASIQALSADYIWQQDCVSLKKYDWRSQEDKERKTGGTELNDEIKPADTDNVVYHGITKFGENIEDEWFVTWILLNLTKQFSDSVVRAVDMDGEFLLIEAADHLPAWAESDAVCQNRVYIYDGKIHLIPLTLEPENKIKVPRSINSMFEAVRIVRDYPDLTEASEIIQSSILERIGDYPKKMHQNFHHANVMVPPLVANVLTLKPHLISPIITSFYYRDHDQLSVARRMKKSKPTDGLVLRRVRFTRCLYAMLCKQDFRPDLKTGWPFPRPNEKDYKSHSLGAKITIGFEILLNDSSTKSSVLPSSMEVGSQNKWALYVNSLQKSGYFREYLPDSKPYNALLEKAREFFAENIEQTRAAGSPADELERLVKRVEDGESGLSSESNDSATFPTDDDDSWMDLNPETFEALLHKSFKTASVPHASLQKLPQKLKKFMNTKAEVEGVDNPKAGGKPWKPAEDLDCLDPLDFRADDFVSAIDKVLAELGTPDKLWDASDEDESSYSDEESFIKEITAKHTFKNQNSKMFQIMKEMDSELQETDVGKTFADTDKDEADEFGDVEHFEPVNVDMNALSNMLKSLECQELPTGPSSNLFRSVGIDISLSSNPNHPSTSSK